MTDILPIVIPIVVVAVALLFIFFLFLRDPSKSKKGGMKSRDRNQLLKDANKRLSQNPKDPEALQILAGIYYEDGHYDKAVRAYELLVDLCATNSELDEFDISLRYALSCIQTGRLDDAYKSLMVCRTMNNEVFDVNYHLGYLEYERKAYEKAVALLRQARQAKPEDPRVLKYLGLGLFKIKKYKEALPYLRKSMEFEPDDKETLFAIGQTYQNLSQNEQALKIFTHLRPDPVMGPQAALFSGTIHLNSRQFERAIMDFSIGLKHKQIKPEIKLELQYRLANANLREQKIGDALNNLKAIQIVAPNYKDVNALIQKYGELNTNQNLQTYLMAPVSDFVTLCRRVTTLIYSDAKVKIVDVTVHKNEYADILAEIETRKWEDLVLFRFMRTTGSIGELMLRDLYGRSKELKAGRGFCVVAGSFTDTAKAFTNARLIDLIEKEDLKKYLSKAESKFA